MDDFDTPNILAVGARLANLARRAAATVDASAIAGASAGAANAAATVTEVDSGRQALAMLRVVPFDLVAVGDGLTDMSANDFAHTLRQAKPWQRWVSVRDAAANGEIDAAVGVADEIDEVTARTLGALAVFDGSPDDWPQVIELARRVRRHQPAATVPGLRLQPRAARPIDQMQSSSATTA